MQVQLQLVMPWQCRQVQQVQQVQQAQVSARAQQSAPN